MIRALLFLLLLSPLTGRGQENAARVALQAGNYPEAERLYTLEVHRWEGQGIADGRMAAALVGLAFVRRVAGNCAEAAALDLRAATILEAARPPDAAAIAAVWDYLGAAYSCQRMYSRAEKALLQALEWKRRAYGDGHPEVADVYSRLALVYKEQKRLREA